MKITIEPIGIINTPFKTKDKCPIQGSYSSDATGTIEIFEQHKEGLQDIETFSHIYLVYFFNQAGKVEYVRPTFLDDKNHGIYASRHPCRPNGIGISIVKLLNKNGNILKVGGIDILDQTPLIDIKPYIPRHDIISEASEGWLADIKFREKPKGRE